MCVWGFLHFVLVCECNAEANASGGCDLETFLVDNSHCGLLKTADVRAGGLHSDFSASVLKGSQTPVFLSRSAFLVRLRHNACQFLSFILNRRSLLLFF